jgi:hypothetical protein
MAAVAASATKTQADGMVMAKKKRGLYDNINARKAAGTSRPKSKSTIDPKVYAKMKRGWT